MENRVIEIIISCFAVYGFLLLLNDIKIWCIRSVNTERRKASKRHKKRHKNK